MKKDKILAIFSEDFKNFWGGGAILLSKFHYYVRQRTLSSTQYISIYFALHTTITLI